MTVLVTLLIMVEKNFEKVLRKSKMKLVRIVSEDMVKLLYCYCDKTKQAAS